MANENKLDPIEQPTVTAQEAADYLGVNKETVYRAVRRGDLPTVKFSRRVLIPTAALLKMLDGAA